MKNKPYIQPISRLIDLSVEASCMQTVSQLPKILSDDVIYREQDVLAQKQTSIWDNCYDE